MSDLRLPADLAWVLLVARVISVAPPLRRTTLKHHALRAYGPASVPVFVKETGASADAVDLRNLDPGEAAEVGWLLEVLTGIEGALGTAPVLAGDTAGLGPAPAEDWSQTAGRILAEAMPEVLAYRNRLPAARVAALIPQAAMRAWSRLLARQEAPRDMGAPPGDGKVAITRHVYAHGGFFALREMEVAQRRFDGTMSAPGVRAVFNGFDAALVLPYDPVRDRVLLIEQFRIAVALRGGPNPWVLEPIAGLVDAGEDPATTARREAMEEAGLTLGDLIPIGRGHPSPGAVTEFYHMFLGLADLPDDASGLGGLASEGEDIRSHILPFDAFMQRIDDDAFSAMPIAMMGLWLARHRDRLRAGGGPG